MKTNVTVHDFIEAFERMGRGDSFSRGGFIALFNYLEEYEDSCDIEIELDPIGIDCDFYEYENLEAFHKEYDKEDYPDLDAIRDNTQVIEVDDDAFIIQVF